MSEINNPLPKDGLAGLKENFQSDVLSGLMVSLIALPLSLGIAKASDFPNPMYGVLTAIIGGLVVSLFAGSKLTIKGPGAGLIVIVAGSVAAFGGGHTGWVLTLGAIVLAGLLQIFFGFLKLGRFTGLFPLPVVHGMLAAVGLIILSKQLHVLIGINPVDVNGKPLFEPLELLKAIPQSFSSVGNRKPIVITGVICLLLIFILPLIRNKWFKKIPPPLLVLFISVPLGIMLNVHNIEGGLLKFNNKFINIVGLNVDFGGWINPVIFFKYVILFALIGSLESMLIVNAVDMLDPYRRKSDTNKELIALGGGNMIAGIFGGLPMIAEVARSSANVAYGGKTRWANFFHGLFLLIFMLVLTPLIEKIPVAALAALLIGVGYKLAHPNEFIHAFRSGRAQLSIFLLTISVTLSVDILAGIFSGVLLHVIFHVYKRKPMRELFNSSEPK